jgi:hypothetical protein
MIAFNGLSVSCRSSFGRQVRVTRGEYIILDEPKPVLDEPVTDRRMPAFPYEPAEVIGINGCWPSPEARKAHALSQPRLIHFWISGVAARGTENISRTTLSRSAAHAAPVKHRANRSR